ncbi:hypothetical protein scyTo_0008187 [Scyliorhinus torazame]|uniref:Uncharacterized protein n=1 Tax=Scyliorhinus torazame TaxID=75743 RepID=A0A401P519_SCYTO|nr:hypothetical protein [Scyliorhinus torazame]
MEYDECCSDFVANCKKDLSKTPAAAPTSRSTSLFPRFTWKPSTTKRPEFISDPVNKQDSASDLGEEMKIIDEPTKPRNENIKIIKESTTRSPISFTLMGNTTGDDLFIPEEPNTMDPNLERAESEKSKTKLPSLNEKGSTESTAPEYTTTDYKTVHKDRMTIATVSEGGTTDYNILDTERMTMPPVNEDVTVDSKSLDKEAMAKPTVPNEVGIMDNLDKEGTIKPTAPDGSATMDPDYVDKEETQRTVTEIYATTYPEIAQSFASNKPTSVNLHILDNEATIQLTPIKDVATMYPNWDKEGATEPPVPKDGTVNLRTIENEKTQTTVPKGSETTSPKISQPFAPKKSENQDVDNLDNPTPNQPLPPEEAVTKLPTPDKVTKHTVPAGATADSKIFDKEGTTKLTVPEEDHATGSKILAKEGITKPTITEHGIANSESLNNEHTQITVPERSATMHPEISQSFVQNRSITVDPNNLDKAAIRKPIPHEAAETILPNLGKVGTTKSTVSVNSATDSTALNEKETANPTIAVERTVNAGSLDIDDTQPTVPEEPATRHLGISQSFAPSRAITVDLDNLDDAATIKPITPEKAATILQNVTKEGTTKPPTPEELTVDSKSLDKEAITTPTISEDRITDTKIVDKEGTTKPTIAKNGAVNIESLDNEDTQTTVPEESATTHPETVQSNAPNRAITMEPDNLDKASTIQSTPPEDSATMLPNIDKERTTVPEEPAIMYSDKAYEEDMQTAVLEKFTTVLLKVSRNRATTLAPINLDNATTTKPIPSEEIETMLPDLGKVETIKPTVCQDSSTDSKIMNKQGMTRPSIAENSTMKTESSDIEDTHTTVPEESATRHPEIAPSSAPNRAVSVDLDSLDNAATIKPIPPEEAATMLPHLDSEGTIKFTVPQDGTMDSKSLDKEETTKTTATEGSVTMDSDNVDKEEKQTTVAEKYVNMYPGISQSFAPSKAITVDPDNLDGAATIKPITPEEVVTILQNMTKEGSAKFSTETFPVDSKSLDKEVTTTPTVSEDSITDSKIVDKGGMTTPSVNKDVMIESKFLDREGIIKPTVPEEDNSTDFKIMNIERTTRPSIVEDSTVKIESLDKKDIQTTVPEDSETTHPEIVQSFTPKRAITVDPDSLKIAATTQSIFPEDTATMLPNIDKERTAVPEEPATLYSDKADKEKTQTTVPEKVATMFPEVLGSFAPNRATTLPTVNLNNTATIKPISPEESEAMLPNLDKVGTIKPTVFEVDTTDSKILDKEGMTKPSVLKEDGTTDSIVLEKEETRKPMIAVGWTMNSVFLDNEETNPTIPENSSTDSKTLDGEGLTTASVPQYGTMDFQSLDKEATTEPIIPEDSTTDSESLNKEGITKPSVTEDGTTHSKSIKTLVKEETTIPPVHENGTMDSKSVDKEGTTKHTVPEEDGATVSKILDLEGTTKTIVVEDGDMNSESSGIEDTHTTVPEESATRHPEIAPSSAPNRAISVDPDSLDNAATIKPIPPEEAATMLPHLNSEGTIKSTVPRDGAMDSKSLDKEGTTKTTAPEGSVTMDSDNVDKEEKQTTVTEKYVNTYPGISQSFAPSRAITVDPDNVDNTAPIKPITPEEVVTILRNVTKEGSTKFSTETFPVDSKSLDKEVTMTPTVSEDSITDSKIMDEGEMTTPPVNKDDMIDSKFLDREGPIKPTVPEEDNSTDFKIMNIERTTKPSIAGDDTVVTASLDNEDTQTTVLKESETTDPEVTQSFAPNRAITVDPDNLDNAATTQSIPPEDAETVLPNIDKEITIKYILPEDSTIDSKSFDKKATTKPTVTEGGSTQSNILDRDQTTKSTIPGDGTVDSNSLDKGGTTKSTTPEGGTLVSKSLDREGTAKPNVLQESVTIHPNILHNKGQAQPTIQEGPYTEPHFGKEEMTKYTAAEGPVTIVPMLNKENMSQPNVLERIITLKPDNLDAERMVNSEESITMDLSLKTVTVKSIVPDTYTEKHLNATSPDHIPQDSDDNFITNVTLSSSAVGSQTTVKSPSYEVHLNDPNLCNKKPSDAVTTLQNGTMYVFRGHLFWTIDQNKQAIGNPGRISDVWGIPSPIDTAFTRCNCNGKTFFFKGDQYWRFQNGVMDRGYPRLIATGFSGLNGKIRAALSVAAHNNRPETVYFFKNGGRYQKYVYHKRSPTTCPQRTGTYTYQVLRRRFKRQTTLVIKKTIQSLKTEQHLVELSVRKNWHGFPIRITSAISFPNPERAEKYEYYVLSGGKFQLDVCLGRSQLTGY